ncbi:hypothetical protein BH23BAC3_BH23BAC3_00610 [soil metagenome]
MDLVNNQVRSEKILDSDLQQNSRLKVLLVTGHPRTNSLSYALANAYEEGARESGAAVERLDLATMQFDPHVLTISPREQLEEDDLKRAQSLIHWANHIVFVYPTWWGTVPALLKGFLDRVLTNEFAFNEVEGGTGYEGLLNNKSARVITTMDTPNWVYNWLYGRPGHKAMQRATLGFCGISPVKITALGPVRYSTDKERKQWLNSTRDLGRGLQNGALTRWDRIRKKAWAWFRAIRLQFYPMTLLAYTVGALAAIQGGFNITFLVGFLCLFFIELATVFTNDYYDYPSDRNNKFYNPFTGGSRVLVDKDLSFSEMRKGIGVAILGIAGTTGLLLFLSPASGSVVIITVALLCFFALGYTVPPLKFSYRGFGEMDVALTHSAGALLTGYLLQGGIWTDSLPWLLSIPLFLSILPAIILAGVPDLEADRAANKKTLAVRFGRQTAVYLAMAIIPAAALSGVIWLMLPLATYLLILLVSLVIMHAAILMKQLWNYTKEENPSARIDRLLALALSFIIWFGLIPLIAYV